MPGVSHPCEDGWTPRTAFGERPGADEMDRYRHAERVDGRRQRRHAAPLRSLPDGTFVAAGDVPALVLGDRLVPWSPAGYGSPLERPGRGPASVLTPPSTVAVPRNGYRPVLHPTAG